MQPVASILTDGYPRDTAFLQSLRQTVCFSGHRPDAFPQGTIVGFPMVDVLKTLLAGGISTMIFYLIVKVKPKFFHAKHYPLVEKYRSKEYKRGPHPMFSTTPVGVISWLLRLLL